MARRCRDRKVGKGSWRRSAYGSSSMHRASWAEALGHALPGEDQEELDRIALEDRRLSQRGLVRLKTGEEFYSKHIDELTREDFVPRIAAELETVEGLKERVECMRNGAKAPPVPSHLA